MPVLGGSTPLTTVNGKSGTAVTLSAADVGAAPAVGNFGPLDVDIPVIGIHQEDPTPVIKALLRRGFTPIWVSELADAIAGRRGLPRQPALMIFDDGAAAWYTTTHAAITAYQAKATMAVTCDYLTNSAVGTGDLPPPAITWAQAREMHATGLYEWQNHTTTHAVNPSTFEMDNCNQVIQAELGVPKPVGIIYPHGTYDAATIQRARGLGLTMGFGYGTPGAGRPVRIDQGAVFTIDRIVDLNEPLKWVEQSVLYHYENDMTGSRNGGNALGYWTMPTRTSFGQGGRSIILDSTAGGVGAKAVISSDYFAVKPGGLLHTFAAVTATSQTAGTGTVNIRQYDASRSELPVITLASLGSGASAATLNVESALSSSCRWVRLEAAVDGSYNGKLEVANWMVRVL